MTKGVINYGLDLEREKAERSEEDHIFGAQSKTCLVQIPVEERAFYLPKGEVQRSSIDDMVDCASRTPVNIIECKLNWLIKKELIAPYLTEWLRENGYITENGVEISDAFVAIKSNTTRAGNSLKGPPHAIHSHGLIPKKLLPLEDWMSFEDYHNPKRITQAMVDLGKSFKKRFNIGYDRVYESNFTTLILEDLLDVGGFAWPPVIDGEYQNVDYSPNHSFVVYAPKYHAFDNYIADGKFTKKLAPDYNFLDYAYRIYFTKIGVPDKRPWYCTHFPNWAKCR